MANQRSTSDLLILMIASTICGVIILAMFALGILEIVHNDADTSGLSSAIANVVNTLVGLLAGFLAGHTQARRRNGNGKSHEPPESHDV